MILFILDWIFLTALGFQNSDPYPNLSEVFSRPSLRLLLSKGSFTDWVYSIRDATTIVVLPPSVASKIPRNLRWAGGGTHEIVRKIVGIGIVIAAAQWISFYSRTDPQPFDVWSIYQNSSGFNGLVVWADFLRRSTLPTGDTTVTVMFIKDSYLALDRTLSHESCILVYISHDWLKS